MMDMMCVKVQDHLNSLRFTETSAVQEDMKAAENLMKDARNSKTVQSPPQLRLFSLKWKKNYVVREKHGALEV